MSVNIVRKHFSIHYPDLLLPDGRRADSLSRFELFDALSTIGVPDIEPHDGLHEQLAAFDNWEKWRRESVRLGRVAS